MFFLYKFNQLNILFLKICKIIKKKPLPYIFEKEIIIHDNEVLFQYLNIFTANYTGISSDFKLINPHIFIWKMFKTIISENKVKNILKKTTNIWKIIKIIEENNFLENIKKNDNKIKKFEFAFLMENLFQKYILYRPQWIQEWKKNNIKIPKISSEISWQIKLWNKMINDSKKLNQSTNNFSSLFYEFKNLIKKQVEFPQRIFIIWSLPINPSYIEIFHKISIYTDIYFLYLTAYKNNIISYPVTLDNKLTHLDVKNNFNNTLEKLWGKYEHVYLLFIKTLKNIKIKNYFKKYHIDNLLNNIKNNILNFQKNKQLFKKTINPKDNSISINICYSKQHEIEVLYKILIEILNTNNNIKPHDIVVTSFELNSYITHINSVFKSNNKKENISFYISEKNCKNKQKILYLFNKILNLSDIRFNNEEILELLDIPIISKNFSISEEEIKILYNWVKSTNIRWGVNKKHQNDLHFLEIDKNTWFYGIDKLLLSYATNEKNKIWNNILSFISIDFSKSELIGKLSHLINILNKWRLKLSKSKKIKYWRLLFNSFINDFFYQQTEWDQILQIINKNWKTMIDEIILSEYQKKITINVLKKNFLYITNCTSKKKIKLGVINFCHPSVVCCIPFKIIYIIGLSSKALSKNNNIDNINLLKKYPLITDINMDDEQRYFFLKNFTAATEYFYMSYIGYSLKNETKIYPSILIEELINYITLYFCFKGDEKLKIEDNIKKISHYLCKKHEKAHIYNIVNIKKIENTQKNKIKNIHKIFFKNIIHLENFEKKSFLINLKDLISFWKHPIRYFFNYTLKTKFSIKQKLLITEPFIIDQLENFKISNILLEKMINKQSLKNTLEKIKLSGILPYGGFGEIALQNKYKEMEEIVKVINQFRVLPQKKDFNLQIEKYYIKGTLKEIQNTGLLRWKSGVINYSDRISLWLEHLVYCILGGIGESKILGYKKQIFSFHSLSYNQAYNYFLKYIKGYIKGINSPLLLTKSGISWLDKVYDIKNQCISKDPNIKKEAYKILYKKWMGNSYIQGEKEDVYIQKIISKLDVKKICHISKIWFTPLLKYKKINEKKIKYI
ncbi:exodeoxyribonuclease V subunit gamma [Buchnera aphidicola (Aphis fabae)]|uniref:RecBCD enzyme subunit RecC n=1 Tax=Buchnera aphidicola (Aphis fabae) TaxID=571430 RepID=A0A5J6ZEG7_9GAMM|nr:exodeoxyribonuclease V subunit gamma [Buchnera aphidicola]QFQ32613.1 exodeoxyribonuclease V subunit gamma [Buchnera aphidicola (Aphis fabae)]